MASRKPRRRVWPWWVAIAIVATSAGVWILGDRYSESRPVPPTAEAPGPTASATLRIPYSEARPILEAFHDRLPPDLKTKTSSELESAWPDWVRRHDAEVRARLERGDEDSLVNFWKYGTTFTSRPRATAQDLAGTGGRSGAADVLLGRLDDLIVALASPGSNERLRFARHVLERRGIDPATPAGREQARAYLVELNDRVIADNARYRSAAQAAGQLTGDQARLSAFASVFSDRGLSSDTSLPIDFALDETLEAAKAKGYLAGGVRRIAIIGPGLDFTDKADGYDFYPQQTIQPFALVDSLLRLGLAAAADVRVTTFDLSPRVNQHLAAARERAERGESYVVQLPLAMNDPAHQWEPGFINYWRRCGDTIGAAAPAQSPPAGPTRVDVRAVAVRPAVVLAVTAHDLNVVLERPASLTDDSRYDLIVATNVLVYYDAFEQALALQNISSMLGPGGFFVTNYAVSLSLPLEPTASLVTTSYWDHQRNFDTLFWYKRR